MIKIKIKLTLRMHRHRHLHNKFVYLHLCRSLMPLACEKYMYKYEQFQINISGIRYTDTSTSIYHIKFSIINSIICFSPICYLYGIVNTLTHNTVYGYIFPQLYEFKLVLKNNPKKKSKLIPVTKIFIQIKQLEISDLIMIWMLLIYLL